MKIIIPLILVVLLAGVWLYTSQEKPFQSSTEQTATQKSTQSKTQGFEQAFLARGNLKTNTAIYDIPLDQVLSGGPLKDGIPALTNPTFISVSEAKKIEDFETEGLSVTIGDTTRFYPYNILVWHEIVNDVIEDTPVLVTFCPLCGSGIAFDPTVDGVVREFGVSGKLWESNMLMYDRDTESLWAQAIGKAVVGKQTGKKLDVISSQLISFKIFSEVYPQGEVLSRKTGYIRTYDFYPYGDYDENDDLYFPVSVQNTRFPTKELMYVVPLENESAAFPRNDLVSAGSAILETKSGIISISVVNGIITATNSQGAVLPGYHEMWFSWATQHKNDGVVWEK